MELPIVSDRKSTRVSISSAPATSETRRSSRSLAISRRQSRASSGSLERRGSVSSLKGLPEAVEVKPSPTALRLRSLARAVRASQALGTLSVRMKYAVPVHEFASDERHMDMMAMLEDTSPLGTAPWARDIKSERVDSLMKHSRQQPEASASTTLASVKSKARWKSAGRAAVGQRTSSPSSSAAAAMGPYNEATGTPSSPLRRNGHADLRASRSSPKRHGSIRGDLNSLLNGPASPHSATATASSQTAGTAPRSTTVPENLDARIFCARSLYKLSCQPGSELAIIQGGAVYQIADFSDVEHPKLLRYCAATLANLTTDAHVLEAFVRNGGAHALLELSWSPCLHVKILCATALCRITQHASLAQTLVRARGIIELLALLALPHDQLQILVVSSVLNLVFHGHVFPDRVYLGEPHAAQSQLGIMSVVSQFATAADMTMFAAEVLFNLSLYPASCASVLRGGGAETLHALAALVGKAIEETGNASSRFMSATASPVRSTRPSWATNTPAVLRMLQRIAETLGNFSAYVEFHGILSTYGMKTLSLLLFGALRDVGSKVYGTAAEVRLQHTVVACSRALANFSSNDDLRKHAFSQEIVHMTTRLTLLDRQRILATPDDARVFFRNIVRTLCNLSFSDTCTAYFMEFPQVLPLLHAIAITVEERADPLASEPAADRASRSATAPSLRVSNLFTGEDVKEDALVTILNLAQQAAYANDLVWILDGKRLALAAADACHSGRLKYIYSLVLCNLLFESRLQQIVYGDLVIHSLVYGFHFFGAVDASDDASGGSAEQRQYRAMNLAFGDDQERFLAAICIMASEIMDPDNIERIIGLILDCLKRPVEAAAVAPATPSLSMSALKAKALGRKVPCAAPVRRGQITCFAAATLYTLARASTQRGDTHNLIHSPAIEDALIAVCERATPVAPAANAAGGSSDAAASCSPGYCSMTQAFCAASLYHLCASGHVSRRIIQALIHCCNANEETLSLLACSASFAIISFTPEGRSELVACAHLATALNRLGRTSQPECQQYAAIAACNVSTLQCIWTSTELKDFIVMALLRANSVQAKQIHAKTLSNLLSHLSTREKAVEDGVLYALMKLSQVMLYRSTSAPQSGHSNSASAGASTTTTAVHSDGADSHSLHDGLKYGLVQPSPATSLPSSSPSSAVAASSSASSMDEVFSIGLQALFNLSCEHQYHQRLLSNGVMAYLAAPVAGKHASTSASAQVQTALQSSGAADHLLSASSFLFSHTSHHHLTCQLTVESRRYAMGIICNLSSYDANHKELMHAQVSDIIRKYVDSDTETRASAAMALRNLSCKQPWVEMLCERKTLQLVISFTQCDHPVVKQFAVEALANCSLITDSLHLYGELRVARAMLVVLEKVAVTAGGRRRATETTRSDDLESSSSDEDNSARALEAPDDMHDADMETCMAALKCLHNLAFDDALALNLMDESAVLRLLSLLEHRALGADEDACLLAATMVHILAGKPRCAESLLRQRVVSLCALLHRAHTASLAIAFECMGVLLKLSTYQQVQETLAETQVIHVVVSICSSPVVATDVRIRECGAITIRNLTLSVAEHLSLFYGESGLDSDESAMPLSLAEDGHTDLDTSSTRSANRSPKKPEHQSAELEPFDTDQDDSSSGASADGGARISRLTERHLLHGVRYFQRELDSLSDADEGSSGTPDAAAPPIASDRIVHEACAGIANLSTIRLFCVAMVRLGIIDTLLRVYHYDLQSSPSRHASTSSTLLRRICAATLHRLAVEDEAAMDDDGLLVPSLLSILKLTDEELHHVRYECEKVSLYQPNSPSTRSRRHARIQSLAGASDEPSQQPSGSPTRDSVVASRSRASSQIDPKVMNRRGSIMVVGDSAATSLAAGLTHVAMTATTHCVKQTYREQKWMLFVLKTTLSSASMIPTLEKKQMKVIGQPRLARQDVAASLSSSSASGSASKYSAAASASDSDTGASESAVKPTGGYLLPVHMDKYTVRHDECSGDVQMGPMRFGLGDDDDDDSHDGANLKRNVCLSGTRITVVDTAVHPLVHRDSPDWASLLQMRKFDRHMRTTRRAHRRNPNSSPVLSLFT